MNASYEKLIAQEIAIIVPDLRLIDLSHYVCHLQQEQYGSIADLVDDICNCYFHPLTLHFANKGDFSLTWQSSPTVRLLMKFNNLGLSASFYLTLKSTCFSIILKHIKYNNHFGLSSQDQSEYLSLALRDARFKNKF